MEWLIGAAAVLFNGVFWVFMRTVQNHERDAGRIPSRSREFPYMQDFWTNGWFGDLLAFSLIDLGVIAGAYTSGFRDWMPMAFIPGFVATIIFYRLATGNYSVRRHADWGYLYRQGKWHATLGGETHLIYFFLQSSIAFLGIWITIPGDAGTLPLAIGWTGAGLYAIAALRDFREGLLTP